MILAAPISMFTGSAGVGRRLKRMGLLRTPEETHPPQIARAADAAYVLYREAAAGAPNLDAVVRDPILLKRHLALTDRPPATPADANDTLEVLAQKKILGAPTLEAALASLTPQERARVQARPNLIRSLAKKHARSQQHGRRVSVP
jgi:membrane glycosyltransferase